MGPHHTGQRIAVGDGQRRITQLGGAPGQLFRMRSTAQERKIGLAAQLGIRPIAPAPVARAFDRCMGQLLDGMRVFAEFGPIGHVFLFD